MVTNMSLNVKFAMCKDVVCPHCNKVAKQEDVYSISSGGRIWYDILETLGYYVPYEKRTKENDWYGKDMVLTVEQAKQVYNYIRENSQPFTINHDILDLIATAIVEENDVVINADW
jgi:hypothetical protein